MRKFCIQGIILVDSLCLTLPPSLPPSLPPALPPTFPPHHINSWLTLSLSRSLFLRKHLAPRVLRGRRYSDYSVVARVCEEMRAGHVRSPFLLALLVDMYEEDGGEEKRQEAVKVCRDC